MALFGTPHAYLGIDIGTSSLKLVELLNRRRRIEVATYAEANLPNILLNPPGVPEDAIRRTASIIRQMMDQAHVATDQVVAALPNSIVFSTVLMLPDLSEPAMNDAVHFAARDIVPADLNDMAIGWSRVGELPHMDEKTGSAPASTPPATPVAAGDPARKLPVFITAAPKDIINRYTRLMELINVDLVALEVETFPLVRSLLASENDSAIIIDIGDRATTYHIIDRGMPRLSNTIEFGGADVTQAIADADNGDLVRAHALKVQHGLLPTAPPAVQQAVHVAVQRLLKQAERLLDLYAEEYRRTLKKTVFIGGGAKLQGLVEMWTSKTGHNVQLGNPWRGVAYPQELESRMKLLGPTYGVAVGLAQRGVGRV